MNRLQPDPSAEPAALTSPLQLPGAATTKDGWKSACRLWYRGDKQVNSSSSPYTPPTDATAVTTWYNQADTSLQASIGSASTARPLFYNQQGDCAQPALKFDGSNDYLQGSFSADIAQPGTVFIVAQPLNEANVYLIDGDTSAKRWQFIQCAHAYLASADGGFEVDCSTPGRRGGTYSKTTPQIWSYEANGSSGRTWQDGVLVATGNAGSEVLRGLTIGGPYSHASLFFTGYVWEVIVFDRLLLTGERLAVQRYLGSRYSIMVP